MYGLLFVLILMHFSTADGNLDVISDNSATNPMAALPEEKTPAQELNMANPINYTSIIEELVDRQSRRNITSEELEELYGHKAKAGLIWMFAPNLLVEGSRQIMFNEIRRYFNFKPQKLRFNELTTKEELQAPNPSVNCEVLTYFQEKMLQYKRLLFPDQLNQFYQQDTDSAERFIDQKYPEHRQLYRVKAEELGARPLTKKNIDEVHYWFTGYSSVFHSRVGEMLGRWGNENISQKKPTAENDWDVPLNITHCEIPL